MVPPLSGLPPEWRIEEARQIADTAAGTVFEVHRGDGLLNIVKVFKERSLLESRRGVDFLEWRAGLGAIRVLGRTDQSVLLEHAGSTSLRDVLSSIGDTEATQVAAEIVNVYHQRSDKNPPDSLQPATAYFESLFRKAQQDRLAGTDSPYIEAAGIARMLLAGQRDVKPLHGDLHHENIMQGERGWLVIDPAGLFGDPVLDVANMFSNPLDRYDLTRDEERIASMAEIFSKTLGRDPRTILQYAFAYGCLSAAWHEEDGNFAERDDELAVAAAVRNVLRRA